MRTHFGFRRYQFAVSLLAIALLAALGATNATAGTLTWQPGWDDFSQPLNYGSSYVSYSSPTSTSLDISYFLVGGTPNSSHDVGIHQFFPSPSSACSALTFGQFTATAGCGTVTRQGVTANVTAFEFGTVALDGSGNGSFQVTVTGLSPGTYDVEFDVRFGPTCPGNCSVIYQSPGPVFGDYAKITAGTPEPTSLLLFGTAGIGVIGVLRRKFRP
jgi:hypothetical protein